MIEHQDFPAATSGSADETDFCRQNDSFTPIESGFPPIVEKNLGLLGNNLGHSDFRRDDYIKTSVSPNVEANFGLHGSVRHNNFRTGISADDYMERRISPVEEGPNDFDFGRGIYADDFFIMYVYKIKKCRHVKPHDWTKCSYAHPGESARRRDPRKYPYFGTTCPGYRKGKCKKGDNCENAHGVFEYWLHPTRYRTQFCKDGRNCNRDVCFFAHTSQQLRVVPSYPNNYNNVSSPQFFENSILQRSIPNPMDQIMASLQQLQLAKSMTSSREMQTSNLQLPKSMPSSRGMQTSNFGGFVDLPTGEHTVCSVPADGLHRMQMEMGNDIMRSGMVFDKLRKENCLDIAGLGADQDNLANQDFGWVSDLVN